MPTTKVTKDRMKEINGQLINAGVIGFLKGTLVAAASGALISYRYNHGHNKRFFSRPYKAWYFICWGIVGITFAVENSRLKITRTLAEEQDLQRSMYFDKELGGKDI